MNVSCVTAAAMPPPPLPSTVAAGPLLRTAREVRKLMDAQARLKKADAAAVKKALRRVLDTPTADRSEKDTEMISQHSAEFEKVCACACMSSVCACVLLRTYTTRSVLFLIAPSILFCSVSPSLSAAHTTDADGPGSQAPTGRRSAEGRERGPRLCSEGTCANDHQAAAKQPTCCCIHGRGYETAPFPRCPKILKPSEIAQ